MPYVHCSTDTNYTPLTVFQYFILICLPISTIHQLLTTQYPRPEEQPLLRYSHTLGSTPVTTIYLEPPIRELVVCVIKRSITHY